MLALNSGATDAIGLIALGGAFTSVMTGNLVLIGVGTASGDIQLALLSVSAVLAFMSGCGVGARLAGRARSDDPLWPTPISKALVVELALISVFMIGWFWCAAAPAPAEQFAFLMLNAAALGIQSSAVQRFGQSGLSTTYLTGTLTTLVTRMVHGHRLTDVKHSGQILLGLVVGALLGAGVFRWAPLGAPILQAGCLALVLMTASLSLRAGARAGRREKGFSAGIGVSASRTKTESHSQRIFDSAHLRNLDDPERRQAAPSRAL